MNQVIMYIMAAGVLLGGVDRLLGNPRGYGKKFEEGFLFLGPTALSMVGMICLAPVLSDLLGRMILPVYQLFGVDPAMFGGILAIDMGGYQLAMELANQQLLGRYSGIVVAAIFGCTVVFTIPVGMGILEEADKPLFARGIMIGLITMPAAFLAGGLICGLSFEQTLWQNMPVFVLAGLLLIGLLKIPGQMVRGFTVFAAGIRLVITVGLILAALAYLTGISLVPGLAPIEDALAVVASIGIVMLGSLPMTEFLQRRMRRPFSWIGRRCGMNETAVAGLLVGMVSAIPAITMIKDMDRRGKIVNVAFLVSAASMLAAHLGFTISVEPKMLGALLTAKLTGGVTALVTALVVDILGE